MIYHIVTGLGLKVEGEHEERAIVLWQYVVVNLLTHLLLTQLEA